MKLLFDLADNKLQNTDKLYDDFMGEEEDNN